nr:AraC family transcriptional regulator [Mogibacterium timidum]
MLKTATQLRKHLLEHSLVLLSGNSLSIAEIAEKLGYANTSKLSTAFKKQYKKIPSEYRTST